MWDRQGEKRFHALKSSCKPLTFRSREENIYDLCVRCIQYILTQKLVQWHFGEKSQRLLIKKVPWSLITARPYQYELGWVKIINFVRRYRGLSCTRSPGRPSQDVLGTDHRSTWSQKYATWTCFKGAVCHKNHNLLIVMLCFLLCSTKGEKEQY